MSEKHSKTRTKKVAILVESSRSYGRGLIRGIGKFLDENGNWQIEYRPRGLSEPMPQWIKSWQGDGILARINDKRMLRLLLKIGLPVVDLRRSFTSPTIPQVGPDDLKVVEMLFEHFRQRGFQRFAFVGIPRGEHSSMDVRRDHFKRLATDRKYPFVDREISMSDFEGSGSRGDRSMIRWLKKLPERTAILACNDDLGLQVLNSCRGAGIEVPKTFSVAGIGNDECLCEIASPKLTSIDLNPIRIGYESAELLQRMMEGRAGSPASVRVAPNRIVPRMSSNTIASDDAVVAAMILYIRQEACNGIAVRDVIVRSEISRSSLENRFRESIGHSVFQEIVAVRLERVQELLVTTDLTIKEITNLTGFNYQGYLMQTFQKQFGMTMKAFRRAYRFA